MSKQSLHHYIIFLLLGLCATVHLTVHAETVEESRKVIQQLKNLNLEELGQVEITLSDTFDIFDSLVKLKRVSVATGTQQSTAVAPAITSVMTTQDIEAIGARNLEEVLETVPGLHVTRNHIGYYPIYTLRGIRSNYSPEVLMLINGIPLSNLFTGNRTQTWGGMPINSIARIEIIRGPSSAVFGADAFAGVINIITKSKEDIKGTEFGSQMGSFNTYGTWLLHSGRWNNLDIVTAIEYNDTDGQKRIIESDAQTTFDKLLGTDASLAPGSVSLTQRDFNARLEVSQDTWQFRTSYQGRQNAGYGAGIGQALDPNGRSSGSTYSADFTYHNPKVTENWDVTAQMSYLDSSTQTPRANWLFPPGAYQGLFPEGVSSNPSFSERHSRLDVSAFYAGFEDHLIRVGVGYHLGELYKTRYITNYIIDSKTGVPIPIGDLRDFTNTSYDLVPRGERKNWHVFIQDAYRLAPNWELTTGVRYDDYSDFGTTTNPRIALVWQMFPELTAKLLYGHASRAPSFLELYSTNNLLYLGNPKLRSEKIYNAEFAFDYRITNMFNLGWNLFTYRIDDKIIFLPNVNDASYTAQNAGVRKAYGMEMEARWKITKNFSLLGNYALQHSKDENEKNMADTPRQSAYARLDWMFIPNWYLDVQSNWVAERKRAHTDPRPDVSNYIITDLTLRYKDIRQGHSSFALGIRNLSDADAREPSPGPDATGMVYIPYDLPLAGRHYFLEFRHQF